MPYQAKNYAEFFEIDSQYYPEINESSIKDPHNKWQDTFPHGNIVALFRQVAKTLARHDGSNKHSIWLEGSYGTGKSRIIWTLQQMFDCSEEELKEYFNRYENLREEEELLENWLELRRGKVVTAYKYATGDITSTQKLILVVFDTLSAALKAKNLKYDGSGTLRGKIVEWLEAETANAELFRAKIKKPEYRMSATLANRTVEEIVALLKNSNQVNQLVEEILKLGEREGIRAFSITMQDLKNWITEVIQENNLKAIVFFWDEFSKFFGNNRNNLDEFQNLVELSNVQPFYLIIATHESKSLAAEAGDKTITTLNDRFLHKEITMPHNIAFELIGHALKVKDVAKKDWEQIVSNLSNRTKKARETVMSFTEITNEKILTAMLPIHPITAIFLKYISSLFASNQRTMFNFIKNNDENTFAFQQFIAQKSPEEGDLLTVDYLWDFFYESEMRGKGENYGHTNLSASVRNILEIYYRNRPNLNAEEQLILKTILIFQSVNRENRDNVEIFFPSEKNLDLAFSGLASYEHSRAAIIANKLVEKKILFKKSGKIEYFEVYEGVDANDLEKAKAEILKNTTTLTLVEKYELLKLFETELTFSQKQRYLLTVTTIDNFEFVINKINPEPSGYKIQLLICLARDENERDKLQEMITKTVNNDSYRMLAIVDATSNLITQESFLRWVECSANEIYYRSKNQEQATQMQNAADRYIKDWKLFFKEANFVYFPSLKNTAEPRAGVLCQTTQGLIFALSENVRQNWEFSFDDLKFAGTLFTTSNLPKMAESGIREQEYSFIKRNAIKMLLGDAWQMSGKYWEILPYSPISELKIQLDEFIKTEIEKNVRVSFEEIINFLIERGFMPCNLYSYLTGFLLKEYSKDPYRYSIEGDIDTGGSMTVEKLTESISECFKNLIAPLRNYRPKYLEIMSANQQKFLEFAAKVFGLTGENSLERCAKNLREKLKELGYPLWCYCGAATAEYKQFLELLEEIATSKQAVGISTFTERAGEFLTVTQQSIPTLKKLLTPSKGREYFKDFLKRFENGEIFKLAQETGVENVLSECKKRVIAGESFRLNDKAVAEKNLKKLITEYQIVLECANFGVRTNSLNKCLIRWKEICQWNIKIPYDIAGSYFPALKEFFAILREIVLHGEIPNGKQEKFLSFLQNNRDEINSIISNPLQLLRDKYSHQTSGLSDEELENIHSQLPLTSFYDTQNHYVQRLNELSQKVKSEQIKTQLQNVWRDVAGNKSPSEWSRIHRMPILAMIKKSEQDKAKEVFETVMNSKPEESAAKVAIDYLGKHSSYFETMNDEVKIETFFREAIIGKYSVLLQSNDEVREEIETKYGGNVYDWYPNENVNEIVKNFAEDKYYSGGVCDRITARIMQMSDEEAKKLLIDLIDKNYEVGLKILSES